MKYSALLVAQLAASAAALKLVPREVRQRLGSALRTEIRNLLEHNH